MALHAIEHEIDAHLAREGRAEREGERCEEIEQALKNSPAFIKEAIGNGALDDLVDAYRDGDSLALDDALDDIVQDYLDRQVRYELVRQDYFASDYPRSRVDALSNVANAFGVQS